MIFGSTPDILAIFLVELYPSRLRKWSATPLALVQIQSTPPKLLLWWNRQTRWFKEPMLSGVRVQISLGAPLNALVVKQADTLSSDGSTFGCMGSNPIESTRCRYRSMVRTSASQAGNTGSIPALCSILIFNDSVAQLVERRNACLS